MIAITIKEDRRINTFGMVKVSLIILPTFLLQEIHNNGLLFKDAYFITTLPGAMPLFVS